MRRSALDFLGGRQSISLAQLSAILTGAARPLSADFADERFIQLYLYAHRVFGLQPGVYRFWPHRTELEQVKGGDQRVAAAGLSLGQDLAGNACVTFSMIGDLDRAARAYGDRRLPAPTQPAIGVGVGCRDRPVLLRAISAQRDGLAGQFLHLPTLCARSAS